MNKSRELLALEEKMFDLVWYARSAPMDDPYWEEVPDDIKKEAWKKQMEVEEEYPEDVAALSDPENGDSQHGFNTGVLAGLRYATEQNRQFANEHWPDCDT